MIENEKNEYVKSALELHNEIKEAKKQYSEAEVNKLKYTKIHNDLFYKIHNLEAELNKTTSLNRLEDYLKSVGVSDHEDYKSVYAFRESYNDKKLIIYSEIRFDSDIGIVLGNEEIYDLSTKIYTKKYGIDMTGIIDGCRFIDDNELEELLTDYKL